MIVLGAGLLAAGPLAGCSTTMQTAARLQLNSARLRASQTGVRIAPAATDRTVPVRRLAVLRDRGRAAFAVSVRNDGRRAVTDLPISVGYTRAGHTTYLNGASGLPYFDAHLPGIAAGRTLTWVYVGGRSLPAGAHPFARVGARPDPPLPGGASAVQIGVDWGRTPSGPLAVRLRNRSGIPQYQLPVFAYALRGSRLLSAGTGTVAQLAGGATRTVKVPLLGNPAAPVTVEALPTIFN